MDVINSKRFCQHIVPLLKGMVRVSPWLSGMQGDAPSYSAAAMMEEFLKSNIFPIKLPTRFSNLNPIVPVWNIMKRFIQVN